LGGILAAVGSAVGLGNIWRFPYETGQNGGAAFLLIYVLCVLMLGTPLMLAELTLGRASHSNAVGAFRRLAPGTYWWVTGFFGAVGVLMIVEFYSVVAGWTLHYTVVSVLDRLTVQDFGAYSQQAWLPFLYMTGFVLLNMLILLFRILIELATT
jgi:NSS family neurotransmitter:Na+ symporter